MISNPQRRSCVLVYNADWDKRRFSNKRVGAEMVLELTIGRVPLASLRGKHLPFSPVTAQERSSCPYLCGRKASQGTHLICHTEVEFWLHLFTVWFQACFLICKMWAHKTFVRAYENDLQTLQKLYHHLKDVCCSRLIHLSIYSLMQR